MRDWWRSVEAQFFFGFLGVVLSACGTSGHDGECSTAECGTAGIGDSCRPPDLLIALRDDETGVGIDPGESACMTDQCAIDNVTGRISQTREECLESGEDPVVCEGFATAAELDERLYCTCNCAGEDVLPEYLCICGPGFECVRLFASNPSRDIDVSYCLREGIER